jgi:enoyl-CoA hydratase
MVLTGAGTQAVCSGADLKNIDSLMTWPNAGKSGPMGISRITDVDKPVIGAINGYCTAGGLELACWCDFRIASADAQFGVLNRRWGVPLADGGTQRLPQIVGLGNALYLIVTGAQINAQHALRMGLIQEIVPPGKAAERALEIAQTVSTYPQTAMRADRKAARAAYTMPIEQGLRYEVEVHDRSLADPAMRDWLTRFAAGERPQPITPPE